MPWCASSARPTLRLPAPVKAPFSWPNSSFSSSVSGIAAQLMATNGPFAAVRELVQRARHQLLAGAAFAQQQHRRVGGGRALDRQHRLLQRGILAQELRQADPALVFLLEQHVLGEQPAAVDGAVEQDHEVVGVHGLGEEVGGAVLHRAHRLVDGAEGGHHHHRHLRVRRPAPPAARRTRCPRAAAGRSGRRGSARSRAAASPRRRRRPPRRNSRGPRGSCAA